MIGDLFGEAPPLAKERQIDDRTLNDLDPKERPGTSFHEVWARELDLRALCERARRLDARAWSRLQGLSIDSDAFQIRAHRARLLSARCDELCRQLIDATRRDR